MAWLCTDVSKNPILLLYCVNGDRGPSLRAQGHRTRRHKEPYLLLSVRMCKCVLSLYLPIIPACPSLSHARMHTRACTHIADPCSSGSGSLLFIRSVSREQTAPWMPRPQMHRNSHNSLPDYKISGLWIWTQWLTGSIYQRLGSTETWSHRRLESQRARNQGRWVEMKKKVHRNIFFFCFVRRLSAKFILSKNTCTGFGHGGQIKKERKVGTWKSGKIIWEKKQVNIRGTIKMSFTLLLLLYYSTDLLLFFMTFRELGPDSALC